ncbi:MAG: winged helix-turn-helix transcriptional regulator [Actinomycetales bacterium]
MVGVVMAVTLRRHAPQRKYRPFGAYQPHGMYALVKCTDYICGLDAALDVVGGKWKPLILWELNEQPHRYGELRRALHGISEKVLTQQLRELENDGIVSREVHEQVPPKVVYDLTALGRSLNDALASLGDWGEANLAHISSVRSSTAVHST